MPADLRLVDQVDPAIATFSTIARWQSYLSTTGKASANTRTQYRRYVLRFVADVLTPLDAVTEDLVLDWMEDQAINNGGAHQTLKALRSYYRWAVRRHGVEVDPTTGIDLAKPKYREIPDVPKEVLEQMFAAGEVIDPRARPTMELIYATGGRVGSIVAATAADVDLDDGWLRFRQAKGDDPYGVPLGKRGRRAVQELLALADYRPPTVATRRSTLIGVGPSVVWRWVKQAGHAVGIEAWPHLLRHLYATEMAAKVKDEAALREWMANMNHKDASQFHRYAHPRKAARRALVEDH